MPTLVVNMNILSHVSAFYGCTVWGMAIPTRNVHLMFVQCTCCKCTVSHVCSYPLWMTVWGVSIPDVKVQFEACPFMCCECAVWCVFFSVMNVLLEVCPNLLWMSCWRQVHDCCECTEVFPYLSWIYCVRPVLTCLKCIEKCPYQLWTYCLRHVPTCFDNTNMYPYLL